MIIVCCVCGNIKVDGEWIKEKVSEEKVEISHGYCDICEKLERIKMGLKPREEK